MTNALFRRVLLAGTLCVLGLPVVPARAQSATPALSDGERIEEAERHVSSMREMLRQVLKVLEEARDQNDIVKLNCVNEKLTQLKGLLNIAEQSHVGLQEAVSRRQAESAQHEFTKLGLAHEKGLQLRTEAEECIGQLAYVVEERTIVEVEEPDDLPSDPTRAEPVRTATVRPPFASPITSE